MPAVDRTGDRAARDMDRASRHVPARSRIRNGSAVNISSNRAARDVRTASRSILRRSDSCERTTVDVARHRAARDLCRILLCRTVFYRDVRAVGVRDRAARDAQRITFGIARREQIARCVAHLILDKAAVCCRCQRTAGDHEHIILDLVADARAPRPRFCVRAIRSEVLCALSVRALVVAEAEAVHVDLFRRRHRMVIRVNRILKIATHAILRTNGVVGIGARFRKVDPLVVVHKCRKTRSIRTRHEIVRARDFHFTPVKPARLHAFSKREERGCRIGDVAEVKAEFLEMLDVLDADRSIDHELVVCVDGLVAAIEIARNARPCGKGIRPITDGDGIARRRTSAIRIAAVDIFHRAARDGDRIARGISRTGMRNKPAVDVSADAGCIRRNRAARDLDHIECCTAARARSEAAIEIAHLAIDEVHGVFRAVLFRRARPAHTSFSSAPTVFSLGVTVA